MKLAAFTGHRNFNVSLPEVRLGLTQLIETAIYEHQIEHFYSGMAIGTDLLAAQVLTEMSLPWTAIIPCLDQCTKWSQNWQKTYFSILSQASSDIVLQTQYSPGCMNRRNAWMVKNADVLLAVWNEKFVKGSGTSNTVRMAMKKGIPVLIWNPLSGDLKTLVKSGNKPKQIQLTLDLTINL